MKTKLWKRVLCAVMALAMTAAMTACGLSASTAESSAAAKASSAAPAETAAPTATAATAEDSAAPGTSAAETTGGTDLKAKWSSLAGKTLRVGTSAAQAGWSQDDGNGGVEGMDIDVMNYMADYYGFNIEWTISEYASLWGMVQNGVIDTIANLTTVKDDRLGLYWFTNTYAWESYSVVCLKETGEPEDGDMDFWADKTIAGEAGSNATLTLESIIEEKAAEGITINELTLDSAAVLIPAVVQKQADAEFQCTSTAAYAVAQSGNADKLYIQDAKWKNMPIVYGWARNDDNKDWILAFNDLIEQMHEDGTLAELSMKWFNMDVTSLPDGEVNTVTTTGDNAWQSYEN